MKNYMDMHDAAIKAYEENTPSDYRYSAIALRKAVDAAIAAQANKPWFPPPMEERPDNFECMVWHRGRWRHVAWAKVYESWMFGYGSAMIPGDLGRLFAPLPWNTPEHDFWSGEQS